MSPYLCVYVHLPHSTLHTEFLMRRKILSSATEVSAKSGMKSERETVVFIEQLQWHSPSFSSSKDTVQLCTSHSKCFDISEARKWSNKKSSFLCQQSKRQSWKGDTRAVGNLFPLCLSVCRLTLSVSLHVCRTHIISICMLCCCMHAVTPHIYIYCLRFNHIK